MYHARHKSGGEAIIGVLRHTPPAKSGIDSATWKSRKSQVDCDVGLAGSSLGGSGYDYQTRKCPSKVAKAPTFAYNGLALSLATDPQYLSRVASQERQPKWDDGGEMK